MRIAVTGSTGLIGSALVRSLLADGHQVVRLVRHRSRTGPQPDGSTAIGWNPLLGEVDRDGLAGVEAVVHLAGAGVGDRRWSDSYKRDIRESRVYGTETVAVALAALKEPPRVLVSASAVGWYGQTGDRVIDEDSPAGDDFLAEVCLEWEAAARPAERAGIRVVHPRTGMVLSAAGGAGSRLFPLFKLGLGGRLGSGQQYWSYISLADEVAALRFLIDREDLSGAFNLTAPEPATNAELTAAIGRALRRPTPFPVPEAVLKVVLGELAVEVVGSHRVVPRRLLEAGFRFAHPDLDSAVRAAL
ncbi:TIGR01777 family oxidoreductase [Kitasatospora aureofaciens]|uniref:Epimerase n=1 Tax=Kitasatospora aureofaciens TaxID=1894 RepID=A0A1E7MYQ8_KITAU|nr:TIGR01777 family oxidoreductase [Kitasatospora aureofaciens]ARF80677.1 TIGR01777 family protein [Kitasatospora aureofaciens]OEV33572.1 TIGR01777 family protein [Kitasatospora aureofaciens]GGU61078.1 epimerase [Kitasatospora aureofaciens]